MTRSGAAVGCGFAAGMAVGSVTGLMAAASDRLMRGWPWPELDTKYALLLAASSVPAAVNGAIGAALACGWGRRGRLGVSVLPASLHGIAALLALVGDPRRDFLPFQLVALMPSVAVWPAGRLGQVVGGALRGRPGPALAGERGR
jgi:hypothetical protein